LLRFIDAGLCEPLAFHAVYAGVAAAMCPDDPPVLVWGRSLPHLTVGATQHIALSKHCPVPVVRRPLGGGAVWVDEEQWNCIAVIPLREVKSWPGEWTEYLLAPMRRVYSEFGVPVEVESQDLWCRGRKIAGTGAASVGDSAVMGSSFLMRFSPERFAECLRLPGVPRQWVIDGLREAITDWSAQGPVPADSTLKSAFGDALRDAWGREPVDSVPTAIESVRIADAYHELQAEQFDLVDAGGILPGAWQLKLNARSRVTMYRAGEREVCELIVRDRCIRRRVVRCFSEE
jgi:lipoate-protein ligase A